MNNLSDGPQTLNEEEINASQTSAIIQGLKPGTSYALAVVAENEIGHGEPSETIRFITSEEGMHFLKFINIFYNLTFI